MRAAFILPIVIDNATGGLCVVPRYVSGAMNSLLPTANKRLEENLRSPYPRPLYSLGVTVSAICPNPLSAGVASPLGPADEYTSCVSVGT